jgi:hypothetical protein
LRLIEHAAPRVVIPGHGAPFTGVADALAVAHARLDALAADPARNARQVARVLIKFWMLDQREVLIETLIDHFERARYLPLINDRYFGQPIRTFLRRTVEDLAAAGALVLDGAWVRLAGD